MSTVPAISTAEVSNQRIISYAEEHGVRLDKEQLGSLRLAQTTESLECAAWMKYYFGLVGDQPPDRDHEIHLDPTPKKEIYKEYVFDMEAAKTKAVCLQTFLMVWRTSYPYCKVRKYKSRYVHIHVFVFINILLCDNNHFFCIVMLAVGTATCAPCLARSEGNSVTARDVRR